MKAALVRNLFSLMQHDQHTAFSLTSDDLKAFIVVFV